MTDTSVRVQVVLSNAGYLACGVYPVDTPSPVSSEILLMGRIPVAGVSFPSSSSTSSSFSMTSSTIANYTLLGLIPSSDYNIYCTSISLTLVPMSTVEMLRSKIPVKTNCCRLLSVRLNKVIVDDVSVLGFALTLDVGMANVDALLLVSISGIEVNSLGRKEMFAPPLVTFASSSSSSKADLTYIPVMSGTYRLNISLSGPSREDYRVLGMCWL